MTIANIALLYPIRFAASSYVLRASMGGAAAENLTFNVTANRDTWLSGDGQSDGTETNDSSVGKHDLCLALKNCLDSHTNAATASVTINASGQLVVASSASTVQLLWDHASTTLDKSIFGFIGDTSAASSVSGSNVIQGRWTPGKPVSEPDTRDRQPILAAVNHAISGRHTVDRLVLPRRERDLWVKHIAKEKALSEYAAATDPYGAFEYAWTNSLSYGRPWRLYTDAEAVATPTYTVYRTADLSDPLTRNEEFRLLWDVRLRATRCF